MSARTETTYENQSSKFLLKSFDYQKQFSHLYSHRLSEMSALLAALAQRRWGSEYPVRKLCELSADESQPEGSCILVGTIYKHQAHKPSILREISEENQLAPQPQRQHYSEPGDKLILEDELQRARLCGKVDARQMPTGVVCAVLGSIEEDGRFEVEQLLYYESGPQRPLPQSAPGAAGRLLVLVSGLDQVQSHNFTDALNLFQHWLGGNIGKEQRLVRLIVAGNSVRRAAEQRTNALQIRSISTTAAVEPNESFDAMRALDAWFAAWSRALPLDVMPGAHDPANFMLPQQPFHACMFPQAARNASFRCVPNPYACTLDEVSVVGCAGQNVRDLLRSTQLDRPLDALRSTLQWSHLAPTAPDTLACYPYTESDPFIMRECPHVYFAGNCDEGFATELHVGGDGQRTRLVCVPSFGATQSVAVVDLETLECREVCFNVQSD